MRHKSAAAGICKCARGPIDCPISPIQNPQKWCAFLPALACPGAPPSAQSARLLQQAASQAEQLVAHAGYQRPPPGVVCHASHC